MAYCPQCGARMDSFMTFCSDCGAKIQADSAADIPINRVEYAGFWIRFVAWIIDAIITNIVSAPLYLLPEGVRTGISVIISPIYHIGFWVFNDGRTPGKMAVKVKIVKMDGSPVTLGTAILRWIGVIIAAIPLGLGFFWIAWDDKKQGWHDKIAGTYVIYYT